MVGLHFGTMLNSKFWVSDYKGSRRIRNFQPYGTDDVVSSLQV